MSNRLAIPEIDYQSAYGSRLWSRAYAGYVLRLCLS